jgi:hypothetical protein
MGFKDQPRDAHGRFLSPKRKTVMPKIKINLPPKMTLKTPELPKVSHKPHSSQPRDTHGRFLSNKSKPTMTRPSVGKPTETSGQLFPEIKGIFSRFF